MGNSMLKHESIMLDRVIDGEAGIFIGVNGNEIEGVPISKQKLCLKDEPYRKLKFFTKSPNNLIYEFEDNIILSFYNNDKNEVYYNLKHPQKNINQTKLVNPLIRKIYKRIDFNSEELDHIHDMITIKETN